MTNTTASKMLLSAALQAIHNSENCALMRRLQPIMQTNAVGIAKTFYAEMLANPNAQAFLSLSLVETRLTASMAGWLNGLLEPCEGAAIDAYLERQIQVGHVHARINIPMWLVMQGMRTIKREFARCLNEAGLEAGEAYRGLTLFHELADVAISLINESYVDDRLVSGQYVNAMRLHTGNRNQALECERHKSFILDWLRVVLVRVQRGDFSFDSTPKLLASDVGLWARHKATFLFPERTEVTELIELLSGMDKAVDMLHNTPVVFDDAASHMVECLNENMSRCSWLLSNLAQEAQEIDTSKDPLTQFFNRRYLPVLLQHETKISLTNQSPFATLIVDIDNFKQVNDLHGHSAGDDALKFVAHHLAESLRSGDQIFRYGGEEFFILLVDADAAIATAAARRIVEGIYSASRQYDSGLPFQQGLTVSVGAAVFDGYPDYQPTVTKTLAALQEAKSMGCNCWALK